MEETENLKKLGMLFGRNIYIDMEGCDPRTFKYAEKFLAENIATAEKLRIIKATLEDK